MMRLLPLFVGALLAPSFLPAQQPKRDLLENFRSWQLADGELEAGTALLDHPWFAFVPHDIAVWRSIKANVADVPWNALFARGTQTRANLAIRFGAESGERGELVLGASLFGSPAEARAALGGVAARIRGTLEPCAEVALVEGAVDPVRAAPLWIMDKGGEQRFEQAVFFAAGPWFVVVAREPDCPVELEPAFVANRAAKAILLGRFVVEAVVVLIDDPIVEPGQRVKATVWFSCFGRPAKGVEVREHLLLKHGEELLGSIEKPDTTRALRDGDSGMPEGIVFQVPAEAEPGSYSIEAVIDVEGIRVARAGTFTVVRPGVPGSGDSRRGR
jgi:hypothetical protein